MSIQRLHQIARVITYWGLFTATQGSVKIVFLGKEVIRHLTLKKRSPEMCIRNKQPAIWPWPLPCPHQSSPCYSQASAISPKWEILTQVPVRTHPWDISSRQKLTLLWLVLWPSCSLPFQQPGLCITPLWSPPSSWGAAGCLKPETMCLWIAGSLATNTQPGTWQKLGENMLESIIILLPACHHVIWTQRNSRDVWLGFSGTQEARP